MANATWHTTFNVNRCKVLHLGSSNASADYTLLGQTLTATEKEKGLGIMVDGTLNFHS